MPRYLTRLISALLLLGFIFVVLASTPILGDRVWTGYLNLSGGTFRPPEIEAASLPAAAGVTGKIYLVTDASAVGNCSTTGGGTAIVGCRSNGAGYDCIWNCATGGLGGVGGPTPPTTDGYVVTWDGTGADTLGLGIPASSTSAPNALVKAGADGKIDGSFTRYVSQASTGFNFWTPPWFYYGASTSYTPNANVVTMWAFCTNQAFTYSTGTIYIPSGYGAGRLAATALYTDLNTKITTSEVLYDVSIGAAAAVSGAVAGPAVVAIDPGCYYFAYATNNSNVQVSAATLSAVMEKVVNKNATRVFRCANAANLSLALGSVFPATCGAQTAADLSYPGIILE